MKPTGIARSVARICGIVFVLCLGCSRGVVWLERGSDAQHLVFELSRGKIGGDALRPLDGFGIGQYSYRESLNTARLVWSFSQSSTRQQLNAVSRVTYGVVPKGYKTDHIATPIGPGCYKVSLTADGYEAYLTFAIGGDGTALEL